jgi:hypothetical protein
MLANLRHLTGENRIPMYRFDIYRTNLSGRKHNPVKHGRHPLSELSVGTSLLTLDR